MINYTIVENTPLRIDGKMKAAVQSVLAEEPNLPINIVGDLLSFADYTIGSVQFGDYNIEIRPRNPAFTLDVAFEMLLFDSLDNFDRKLISTGFGSNSYFGADTIASQFCIICRELVRIGITGGFLSARTYGKEVCGRICLEDYHPKYIPLYGVPYEKTYFDVNVYANQIIKSALIKLERNNNLELRGSLCMLLDAFRDIDECGMPIEQMSDVCKSYYSLNPYYPIAMEFAIQILKGMRSGFTHGTLAWRAFLHNSNDIFERYVRKVLAKGLDVHICKWDEPRKVASLSDGTREGSKSYIPDILVDYDPWSGTAKAVLDAKNKVFETNHRNIGDILAAADMYQLSFYCDKLKTNLGALIYPASGNYPPIAVSVDGSDSFRFFMFAVNLHEDILSRNRRLCSMVNDELLRYI